MRKFKIAVAVVILLFAGISLAQLTVTLVGATTYANSQWRSMCISNKPNPGPGWPVAGSVYTLNIEVCPSNTEMTYFGTCSTTTITGPALTAGVQTVINYALGVWNTEHPEY
jgi:hypothetical protein